MKTEFQKSLFFFKRCLASNVKKFSNFFVHQNLAKALSISAWEAPHIFLAIKTTAWTKLKSLFRKQFHTPSKGAVTRACVLIAVLEGINSNQVSKG